MIQVNDRGALLRMFPPSKVALPDRRVEKAERLSWLPKSVKQVLGALIIRSIRKHYVGDAWYSSLSEEQRKTARECARMLREHQGELKIVPQRKSLKQRIAGFLKTNPAEAFLVREVIKLVVLMCERVREEERRGDAVAAIFAADPEHEAQVRKSREQIAAGDFVTLSPEQLRNRSW